MNSATVTAIAPDVRASLEGLGIAAQAAARVLANTPADQKNRALLAMAAAIRARTGEILAANGKDVENARTRGIAGAMLDRLILNEARVEAMAKGVEEIAALHDPVGEVIADWIRPNGLHFQRVRIPLGVIGIIYESRPNVTADAGALCLKSGNASILRGGSESVLSSRAIHACLQQGLRDAGLPAAAIQLVPTQDRAAVGAMLGMSEYIDVIVPRGGKSLVERVQQESRIPVFAHLEGICHTYVDKGANLEMARAVVLNAKMRRTGICGATETLLIDRPVLHSHLPAIVDDLTAKGCEVRGDAEAQAADVRILPATEADWDTEYLDSILAVKVVDGVREAVDHIARHGSNHTESIITDDPAAAECFLNEVGSAIVMHNASTQFADGGEFGFGAEIGISNGKMHARGPVGVEQLTTFKYVVRGSGQVRP